MADHFSNLNTILLFNESNQVFFGFSEFLAGLALMVLAWTIGDLRYRFRIKTALIPLQKSTYTVIAILGFLTLMTDLWHAEKWFFPLGNFISFSLWQALLGLLFLLTFLIWAWFAFIRPPVFGKLNAKRYVRTLYKAILKGSSSELAVIADEFSRSVKSLISYANEFKKYSKDEGKVIKISKKQSITTEYANEILLMIADKRFCRAIVESSPIAGLAIFNEISKTKKYGVPVEIFAKNLVSEALSNKDSFLFHEDEGYKSGLLGFHKPLSKAIFSNYKMIKVIGTILDPELEKMRKWDATQWEVYCRVVLITFRDYVENDFLNHPHVLYRAKGYIERSIFDLYKINGVENIDWNNDILRTLDVVIKFIKEAIEILDKKGVPENLQLHINKQSRKQTFYDHLASMIVEVIFRASSVRSPANLCWEIQNNLVWGEFFNFDSLNCPAGKVVKFKVRRLIYDEIIRLKRSPNFKGAKILGFCLNVLGFKTTDKNYERDSIALQKAILSWTKKNYVWLHDYNPRVAEACLVDNISYDKEHYRLVKTKHVSGLRCEPNYIYFSLDPPQE